MNRPNAISRILAAFPNYPFKYVEQRY